MGRKREQQGEATPAAVAARRAGVAFTVHRYDTERVPVGGNYGVLVAEEIGAPPEQVFKTLIASVDGRLTVAVVPVSASLDLKALAAAAGGKRAAMADPAEAERATGYVTGGISPLGQRRRLATYVDSSALRHEAIYCSAGRRGMQLRLAPADLIRACDATTAPIATAEHD